MPRELERTPGLRQPIADFSNGLRDARFAIVGAAAGVTSAGVIAGSTPGRTDIAAQSAQMLSNIETTLALLDASWDDVVRTRTWITDWRDLEGHSEVFARRVPQPHAASAVKSDSFPVPNLMVEVEVIAAPGQRIERPRPGVTLAGGLLFATVTPEPAGDIADQSRAALRELADVLSASGLRPADLVYVRTTLADPALLAGHEAVYEELALSAWPARTLNFGSLRDPAQLVELEVVAASGGGRPVGGMAGVGLCSPAIEVGELLFCSGQVSEGATVSEQTRRAWKRLLANARDAGFGVEHVALTNNVLTDWRSYAAFNVGYGASTEPPHPPRATVNQRLNSPWSLVQIEALMSRSAADAHLVAGAA